MAALWIASLVVVGTFAYFQFIDERQRLAGDLDRRAALLSDGLKEALEPALARSGSKPQIDRLIRKTRGSPSTIASPRSSRPHPTWPSSSRTRRWRSHGPSVRAQ